MMTAMYSVRARGDTVRRYVIGGDPKEWISDAYIPGKFAVLILTWP